MPFPVAHSLIGASVGAAIDRRSEAFWQILLLSALLGVCPDFDYVLNWLRIGRASRVYTFARVRVACRYACSFDVAMPERAGIRRVQRCDRFTHTDRLHVGQHIFLGRRHQHPAHQSHRVYDLRAGAAPRSLAEKSV